MNSTENTQQTQFFGLAFYTCLEDEPGIETPHTTYIPRRETEQMVRRALDFCRVHSVNRIVDIATGSGCIAVSLKKNYPQAQVTAIDISGEALEVAQHNAQAHQVEINFIQGSWFEPVEQECFDLILCNPPYVPPNQREALSQEAAKDPLEAHHPGMPIETLYKQLLNSVKACLMPQGLYIFEIGFEQFDIEFDVVEFAKNIGLTATYEKDNKGFNRFLYGSLA